MRTAINLSAMVAASVFAVSCVGPDEAIDEGIDETVDDPLVEDDVDGEVGEADELAVSANQPLEGVVVEQGVEVGVNFASSTRQVAAPTCPSGYFCIWQHAEKRGWGYGLPEAFYGGGCRDFGSTTNNQISSWQNHTRYAFHLYANAGCRGSKITVPSGTQRLRLAMWNDLASSFCVGPSCR